MVRARAQHAMVHVVWHVNKRRMARVRVRTMCVVIPFIIMDDRLVDVPAGVTQEEGDRISPPFFCGACLEFSREKDSADPFPRRP